MRITTCVLLLLFAVTFHISMSRSDSFGTGANSFEIEFVTIGDPGNLPDTTGKPNPAGSVPYVYRMGKHEISREMVIKANRAGLFVTMDDLFSRAGQPATGVTWYEAAQFANWLNTDQGFTPAYKFGPQGFQLWEPGDLGYNPNNLFRNSLAKYVLPSTDEWYKAAFYDPASDVYYDYATGSNSPPAPVASGTGAGTSVFGQTFASGPADVTQAGGLSPYGTMGQGGNIEEFEETEDDLLNDFVTPRFGNRGGSWIHGTSELDSSYRFGLPWHLAGYFTGFRIASVTIPDPSSLTLLCLCSICLLGRR